MGHSCRRGLERSRRRWQHQRRSSTARKPPRGPRLRCGDPNPNHPFSEAPLGSSRPINSTLRDSAIGASCRQPLHRPWQIDPGLQPMQLDRCPSAGGCWQRQTSIAAWPNREVLCYPRKRQLRKLLDSARLCNSICAGRGGEALSFRAASAQDGHVARFQPVPGWQRRCPGTAFAAGRRSGG